MFGLAVPNFEAKGAMSSVGSMEQLLDYGGTRLINLAFMKVNHIVECIVLFDAKKEACAERESSHGFRLGLCIVAKEIHGFTGLDSVYVCILSV